MDSWLFEKEDYKSPQNFKQMKIENFTNNLATKYVRPLANFSIRALVMFLIVGLTAVSCGKTNDDDDDDNEQLEGFMYGVNKGTIEYKSTSFHGSEVLSSEKHTIIFDDKGQRSRLEIEGSEEVLIFDAIAKKYYILMPYAKEYIEMPYSGYGLLGAYLYLGDDLNSVWKHYSGFKKLSNKTIAGKNCTVYSWSYGGESVECGGWKRITFWLQSSSASGYSSRLEATSFKETIPGNSFTPPADYTKIDF